MWRIISLIDYTLGDKEAALKYYSKLVQCGDSKIERIAKQRIKEIKAFLSSGRTG